MWCGCVHAMWMCAHVWMCACGMKVCTCVEVCACGVYDVEVCVHVVRETEERERED